MPRRGMSATAEVQIQIFPYMSRPALEAHIVYLRRENEQLADDLKDALTAITLRDKEIAMLKGQLTLAKQKVRELTGRVA